MPRFLFALGIPQVGESTARALAEQFGDLEPLMKADAARIEETPDVGPIVSQEIAKFFADPGYREVVSRLIDRGWPNDVARERIAEVAFEPVAFDADAAYAASLLRPLTRQAGLSLGDRACLALAQRLGVPAITADRAWTTLGLPITVQVIR